MLKWFSTFIHVTPADYEAWLEKLAVHGYHPKKVNQWSTVVMEFKEGEPKKYRYVLDIQPVPQPDYVSTYEEFGWELCGQMASTYLWRMEYTDERPESFSDGEAYQERNKRFVAAISFSLLLFFVVAIILTVGFSQMVTSLTIIGFIQFGLGMAFTYGIVLYLFQAIMKIPGSKHK